MQNHIKYKEGKKLTGTARYASINTHKGVEQSRRDDFESLGYVLLYLLRGSLPWQGLPAKTKEEKYTKIKNKKIETKLEDLCQDFPNEFIKYIEYCREIEFTAAPNYEFMETLFTELFQRLGYKMDY